jgi:hypothetical protein
VTHINDQIIDAMFDLRPAVTQITIALAIYINPSFIKADDARVTSSWRAILRKKRSIWTL